MTYPFKNLVFEGGGVKGIAYVGALEALEARGILPNIRRVGGTSAGAIVAALLGVGYGQKEVSNILWEMDFGQFTDTSRWFFRNFFRLKNKFGWHKGKFFRAWMDGLLQEKTGMPNTTFGQLRKLAREKKEFRHLYFMVTNLSTGFSETMSAEKTPDACIADAVRFSMSIPFFFASKRSPRGDVYVDGGVLDNYPVKLFDREKYLHNPASGQKTSYYEAENKRFLQKHPKSSPYVFNKETLGFRLDEKSKISQFRDNAEPVHRPIHSLVDFISAVVHCYMDSQSSQHLHSDDWRRTIYIDTLGVSAIDFSLGEETKKALVDSGRQGVHDYFAWYDAEAALDTSS